MINYIGKKSDYMQSTSPLIVNYILMTSYMLGIDD